MTKKKDLEKEIDREAMKLIYMNEIQKSNEILQKKFKIIDDE